MVKCLNTLRRYLNTSISIWVFKYKQQYLEKYLNTVVEVFVTTLPIIEIRCGPLGRKAHFRLMELQVKLHSSHKHYRGACRPKVQAS